MLILIAICPPLFVRLQEKCVSVRLVTVLCRRQIPVIQVRYKTSADVLCPYSLTCVTQNSHIKDLNDKWYLNAGRKYCRILPLEYSAVL